MIDIQQRALRPLEEDAAPARPRLIQLPPHRGGVGQQPRRNRRKRVEQRRAVHGGAAVSRPQGVVMEPQPVHLRLQRRSVAKVADTHRPPPDLVLVRRTDATPGRADPLPARVLAQGVQLAVERQDQRRAFRNRQRRGSHVHALPANGVDLVEQRPGIDDHAVAQERPLPRPHHPRRKQAQPERHAVDDQGMAGIVPALKAHDEIGPLAQPVDDLPLAFVAPLGAHDDDVGHACARR